MLITIRTNYRTLRATVTAITNIFYTISANVAVVAPAVVTDAGFAVATVGAYITGTVAAFLCTSGAYLCTI